MNKLSWPGTKAPLKE